MSNIRINDYGTTIVLTATNDVGIPVDISNYTDLNVWFKKPDGETFTKPAVLEGTGKDGKFYTVTENGDIDQVGIWYIRGIVTTPSSNLTSEQETFYVEDI